MFNPRVAILAGVLCSCATGASLHRQADSIRAQLDDVRAAGAYRCAPAALARSEAELEFLLTELDQGHAQRASEHRDRAGAALTQVVAGVQACAQDADRDGVLLGDDRCPDMPGPVSLGGCPDQDNDGIIDINDQCPTVPEDRDGTADEDGCPESEDRDGDGIVDPKDQCPDAPEDVDQFDDLDGCPDPDNDADGIPDPDDACPMQPETKNDYDDEDGCPDKKLALIDVKRAAKKIEIKERVFFRSGRARIKSRSYRLLNQVAQALKTNPTMQVVVEGHTDSVGSARANRKLSRRRARAVRRYLIRRGVEKERLTAIGFGEKRPLQSNRTRAGRRRNRRVEFTIAAE